jgi:hypothetical protein
MSDLDAARGDLAFLRGLVDEDWRPGVWSFGALYVAIGVVLIIHVLLSWAAQHGVVPLQGRSLVAAYVVLYAACSGALWWARSRSRALFGAKGDWAQSGASVKGRAGAAVLAATLIAHVVIMIAFVAAARRLGDARIVELLPVTLFALQGVAWIVVHTLRRQGWQSVIAWGWFAAAVGVGFVVAMDWFAPFVAAAALALMVVPGFRMMRSARAGA